mmetsp:Transcript_25337/g.45699  ORF Transcript_25337/g.45699 Transcript_25337/m.45699 type:complete len:209 (-) Transcript_25337:99-725(-)
MASINWIWAKLCCRVPVREKDDGEWMEPIQRKKPPSVLEHGASSTDNNVILDTVREDITAEKPSATKIRWSDIAVNLDQLNIEDLEDDGSIHDEAVFASVNSAVLSTNLLEASLHESIGAMSMGSLFSEDSVSRQLGGFRSSTLDDDSVSINSVISSDEDNSALEKKHETVQDGEADATIQQSGGTTKKSFDPWRLSQMGAPQDAAYC